MTAAHDGEVSSSGHVTIIEPARGWIAVPWRELWQRRELFLMLAGRDLRIRYKQTVLGVAWAVLQPLLSMALFSIFFGRLARMPSEGLPYPLFALLGLVPWTLFNNAIVNSANSLVVNAPLLTKVYFPRLLLPAAAVLVAAVDAMFALALLLLMMVGYRVPLRLELLLLAPLLALAAAFSLGCGLMLSAANAKYRDVRHVVPFALQVAMFASPIIYPSSLVPERFRALYAMNPLGGVIEATRAVAAGSTIPWGRLGISALITLTTLSVGVVVFRRFEQYLTDTV